MKLYQNPTCTNAYQAHIGPVFWHVVEVHDVVGPGYCNIHPSDWALWLQVIAITGEGRCESKATKKRTAKDECKFEIV